MFSQSEVINNLREKRKRLEETLEIVREFVLSRRSDIEKNMEDFGMLKPVLDHFLEEAEGHSKA